jgi:hypothetical protein
MRVLGYLVVGAALKSKTGCDVMSHLVVHVGPTLINWFACQTPDGQPVYLRVFGVWAILAECIHDFALKKHKLLWGVQRNHILANDWQGTANAADQATAFRLW